MDEEMEDFIVDRFSPSEIDADYEYDASRFFDFARPETYSEGQEAERWFESASSYPPSPFIVKLNWGKDIPVEVETTNSQHLEAGEDMNSISNISDVDIDLEVSSTEVNKKGLKHHNDTSQGILNSKKKSLVQSFKARSSTLMKPTASHLAKQNKARDVHSSCRGRLQKQLVKGDERSLQHPPGYECQATKRQKLEIGYLRKVAHLKHQTALLHKIAKKVGRLDICSRSKVTVPREPDLETAQRAQRRSFRSKNNSESGQPAKPNAHTFKARPLNRKILETPLPLPKKSVPKLPKFQVFHLKTTERAMQHLSTNVVNTHSPNSAVQSEDTAFKRSNPEDASEQEKCETLDKLKAWPLDKIFLCKEDISFIQNVKQEAILPTDFKVPTEKRLSQNPPTELFVKLSLKPESETKIISQSKQHHSTKGSKENLPSSFQHEFWKSSGKPSHCGSDRRIPEVGCQQSINRSMDIRSKLPWKERTIGVYSYQSKFSVINIIMNGSHTSIKT